MKNETKKDVGLILGIGGILITGTAFLMKMQLKKAINKDPEAKKENDEFSKKLNEKTSEILGKAAVQAGSAIIKEITDIGIEKIKKASKSSG